MPAPVDVLIVDDQPELVLLLNRLFEFDPTTFTVRTVADDFVRGVGAALRERTPDVVVLDMWLEPDGLENDFQLSRELFHLVRDQSPSTKIVLYSAVLRLGQELVVELVADVAISKTEPMELIRYVAGITPAVAPTSG